MHRRTLIAGAALSAFSHRPGWATAKHPVVLELFTSQACSSCPPADALLGKLARQPNIVALAWHVDYWNHLGWRDPFATRTATDRQQAYAAKLGGGVFTPALVVNGSKVVIGSQHHEVEAAIAAAATLPVAVKLAVADGGGLSVEIGEASQKVRVQRIVYDPEHITGVDAGENDGTRLHEYRIVRDVETLGSLDGVPGQFNTKQAAAGQGQVIIVQSADLRVLGAVNLPPS
jgi:hypothetical protein